MSLLNTYFEDTLLEIWAIISVLLGSSSVMRKVMWSVIILLLPLIGVGLYFLIGRYAADARV